MSDPVLVCGLVLLVLVMVWFFGAFDQEGTTAYVLALEGGGLSWKDDRVALEFGFENPEELTELKHIPLAIKNVGSAPLTIQWSASLFIDPAGRERALQIDTLPEVHEEGKPLPHSVLEPGQELDVLLIPSDRISPSTLRSGFKRGLLLDEWNDQERFGFKVKLTVGAAPGAHAYEISFLAARDTAPNDARS